MNCYIYLGGAIAIILVLYLIYSIFMGKPKKYGDDFLSGYWLMNLSDANDELVDEQVLFIEKLKNKNYNFIYAFDEDEDPIKTEYKRKKLNSKYYREHDFFFEKIEGEGPEKIEVKLDTIDGTINLTNGDGVSYGLFCKDNTIN